MGSRAQNVGAPTESTVFPPQPELAGEFSMHYGGRDYRATYRIAYDLLTVYCGLASNTALVNAGMPSPIPQAERLLCDLIDAEHPGLESP